MPDDQEYLDEDLAGYGSPPVAVAPPVAPPPATFGYMYGSSRYANEPPVPRPTQAQLEALPANTLTDIPGAGWAYRETVPHQERLMQLDREAQRARQAAESAAQDAQMFAQMSRVARSVKDIEIARRSIDVMGLQRDIQNGVPIHDAVTRHPLALGSGYGSALQHTAPVVPPTLVTSPSGEKAWVAGTGQHVTALPPTLGGKPIVEDFGNGVKGIRISPNRIEITEKPTGKIPIDAKQEIDWRNADIKAIQRQKEALLKAGTRADAPDIAKLDAAMEEQKNAVRALQKTPSGSPAPKPPANRVNVVGPPGPDGQPRRGTVPKGSKLPEGWTIAP